MKKLEICVVLVQGRFYSSISSSFNNNFHSAIKQKLNNYLYEHFKTNFKSNNKCTFHFLCPCSNRVEFPRPCYYNLLFIVISLLYS